MTATNNKGLEQSTVLAKCFFPTLELLTVVGLKTALDVNRSPVAKQSS